MRRRRPPDPPVGLFERPAWVWRELGLRATFGDGLPEPPGTPWLGAIALVEQGALTPDEIEVLRAASAGDVPDWLGCSCAQADGLLARWSGPIEGLKLRRLPHWRRGLHTV